MACLEPGRSVDGGGIILPVRYDEAALAVEDIVPRLVNATPGVGDCRAVAAITDRFETCVYEQSLVEVPMPGSPIVALAGEETTQAWFDSWLAKGTLLGEDGRHCVFVAFMDVMRRPLQGSWTVESITVLGTKQSVASLLREIEQERSAEQGGAARDDAELAPCPAPPKWGIQAKPLSP